MNVRTFCQRINSWTIGGEFCDIYVLRRLNKIAYNISTFLVPLFDRINSTIFVGNTRKPPHLSPTGYTLPNISYIFPSSCLVCSLSEVAGILFVSKSKFLFITTLAFRQPHSIVIVFPPAGKRYTKNILQFLYLMKNAPVPLSTFLSYSGKQCTLNHMI